MVPLGKVLRFSGKPERIRKPESEVFVTVRLNGRGAVPRNIGAGKTPVAFTGYRVQAGQFIYSRIDARNGAFAIIPPELDGAVVSKDFPVFDIQKDAVDTRYLIHYFMAGRLQQQIQALSQGATNRQRITEERFLAFTLPLPPLIEQRRIAAILDCADSLRTKRRQIVSAFESLRQSVFIDMFGDPASNPRGLPTGTIRDLVQSADYGTSERSSQEGDIAVLRMNNITYGGDIDLRELKYMTLPVDKYDRYTVRKGDVLFNRTNSADLVGKTAVYHGDNRLAYAGYLVRLRVHDGFSPDFLSGVLNSDYGKATLRGMCKSIVGMANINAREVQTIRTLIPPAADQAKYSVRIERIRAEKDRHRAALAALDRLFESVQARAFRREL
ncbi:hypothetical protein A5664_17325 [Mycolicibacterium fortuitum]|uniref:restriction endonuclease subunit S n=1 Tax=Mycolicibacterium fortuitum TaxID=1766 RepID=UPI0007EAEE6B|nr:restriction endonuclease subunit S [Mycolicibacterium fortuitum]OBA94702.1 hypothetical protein A5668_08970 [Mycolicibacterium fortuitum]OBI78617.1 hypothetical protein A5664_17325 [Mycolicibacterium fortuitum]